ncbi:MAG: DUF1727 domain-containing protein [Clostridia bacterium]|nr:DUF1727 domain-containing protein [Clostridia bacterium]MBQ5820899.1 DUF1727 domain-containing protein [Clostridia bacterium]
MMKAIVILLCKLLSFVGRIIGKGTSLPGAVALKLRPKILSELALPPLVIAVTGSNGKTSTVEMIASVLEGQGKRVLWNKEGSNQIEGVTTLLLNRASLSGTVSGDVVVFESDERYARHTFRYIKPTHFAVTNLYRDQLTRNVHPFRIYSILQDAVDLIPDAMLILNGDDPIIRRFGEGRESVVYFGMSENSASADHTDAVYNDCFYCPVCGKPLEYKFFHFAHLGDYSCPACGYARPTPAYAVDSMDLSDRKIAVNGHPIHLAFASKYNVYNLCAAFAVCSIGGIAPETVAASLSDFIMKNGRVVRFTAGENQGLLITSKHENSTSYNQSLEYVASQPDPSRLVIIVDAISRKYYTSETSWLWDISFEVLRNTSVKQVLLCGKYAYDLAVRFEAFDWDGFEVIVEPDLDRMGEILRTPDERALYAVTCFSDKDKLYSRVSVQSPTAK